MCMYSIETIRYYYIICQKFSMILNSTNYTMKKVYICLLGSSSMTNLVLKLQPWRSPKQGENHMWEPCSQPKGKLRVTLILLFVAGPIGVHPPPSQHASPLPSPLLRHGLLSILWYLPSWVTEVHSVAFETSREGTLTSIFRIELRSFRVQNSWWKVHEYRCVWHTRKQDIFYVNRKVTSRN